MKHYQTLELYSNILSKYSNEIQTLRFKQEELEKREQDILTIKDNTTQILQLLLEQQDQSKKIQSLNKTKEIQHKGHVRSITELNDSRIATGDAEGYIRLFTVDDDKEQWTKIKEEKGHGKGITPFVK